MKVTIELVRRMNTDPYYFVSTDPYQVGNCKCISFRDDALPGDIYDRNKALKDAMDYAVLLKDAVMETREVIAEI